MLSGCFEKCKHCLSHAVRVSYIYLHLVDLYSKCRSIWHGCYGSVHVCSSFEKNGGLVLIWVVIEPVASRPQQLHVYQSWRQGEIAVSQGDAGTLAETSKVPRLRNSGDLFFGEWWMKSYPVVGILFIGTQYAFKTFVGFCIFFLEVFLRNVMAGCICPLIWKGWFPTWCLAGGYVG